MTEHWALLAYRVPREPSTPRITIWRRLRKLGVLRIGDGLVALPADPETLEALEWIAEAVTEADGDAWVFTAQGSRAQGNEMRSRYDDELQHDVDGLIAQVNATDPVTTRQLGDWGRRYRDLQRRDRFSTGCTEPLRRLLEARAARVTEVRP